MIHADCKPINNNLYEVRFSDPNESFGKKPYELTASMAEINRILYSKNRNYLVTTISMWLNQREHAIKDPKLLKELYSLKDKFSGAIRITSYYNICAEVRKHSQILTSLAPPVTSKYFKHYQKVILHIINHCHNEGSKSE